MSFKINPIDADEWRDAAECLLENNGSFGWMPSFTTGVLAALMRPRVKAFSDQSIWNIVERSMTPKFNPIVNFHDAMDLVPEHLQLEIEIGAAGPGGRRSVRIALPDCQMTVPLSQLNWAVARVACLVQAEEAEKNLSA